MANNLAVRLSLLQSRHLESNSSFTEYFSIHQRHSYLFLRQFYPYFENATFYSQRRGAALRFYHLAKRRRASFLPYLAETFIPPTFRWTLCSTVIFSFWSTVVASLALNFNRNP